MAGRTDPRRVIQYPPSALRRGTKKNHQSKREVKQEEILNDCEIGMPIMSIVYLAWNMTALSGI